MLCFIRRLGAAAVVLGFVGCGGEVVHEGTEPGAAPSASSLKPVEPWADTVQARIAVEAERFARIDAASFHASHPGHGLRGTFRDGVARFRLLEGASPVEVNVRVEADTQTAGGSGTFAEGACSEPSRVGFDGECARRLERNAGVGRREWWKNTPRGFEHGIDVTAAAEQGGEVRAVVAWTGATLREVGSTHVLLDAGGRGGFRYGELAAYDADRKALPAHFEKVDEARLAIVVDTRNARFPIEIDPYLTWGTLTPAWTKLETQASAYLGTSVTGLGDVNLDGYDDVAIGAPQLTAGAFTNAGKVFIFHGSATGLPTTPTTTLAGTVATGLFGQSVGRLGDFNGDGYPDLIVGAPREESIAGEADEGRAYFYLGSAAGISTSHWIRVESNVAGARMGDAVAGIGDLNGDNKADAAVGAPEYDNGQANEGKIWVYHGRAAVSTTANRTYESDRANARAGYSLTGGDLDGDGYSDLLAGAPGWQGSGSPAACGAVLNFVSTGTGLPSTPNGPGECQLQGGAFGRSVAVVRERIVVGGPGAYKWGSATQPGLVAQTLMNVFTNDIPEFEESTGYVAYLTGPSDDSEFGQSLCNAGDLDGNGTADLAVGAPRHNDVDASSDAPGRFSLFAHSASGHPTVEFAAVNAPAGVADRLGQSVASAGDVNGDGFADLVVGAPRRANGATTYVGAAEIYYGRGLVLGPYVANQPAGGDGSSVGDINGDGFDDLFAGGGLCRGSAGGLGSCTGSYPRPAAAYGDLNADGYEDRAVGLPTAASNWGRVEIYYGRAAGFAASANVTLQGGAAGDAFGSSVAIGDVTGDGVDDLIVGSPNYTANDTGRFDVFGGSASGVASSATWGKAIANISANFGVRMGDEVAVAGDVNGDGIGDVLTRASGDGASKPGRVQVWLGGTVAPASFFVLKVGVAVADNYGAAISTVGDIDGDGYAEFAVGVPGLKKIELYRGASATAGVVLSDWNSGSSSVDLAADHGARLMAGDFNGDGYGDLIGAGVNKGVAYFGNAEAESGRGIVARALTSGGVRIRPGGYSDTTNSFTVRVTALNPFGPARVKLQVEAKPFGTAFNGTGFVQSSSWTSLATHTATATLDVAITGLAASSGYRWRARLLYDATLAPPQSHSPWHYGGLHGQRIGVHVRTTCAGTDTDGDHYCDSTDADDDGDFSLDGVDCAPLDGAIFPGATDVGDNGVDEDCSGRDATFCKQDQDLDGYGNDYLAWEYDFDGLCDAGYADSATDCNDLNNAMYPGNPEVCDLMDNDCEGGADEGGVCSTPSTWYSDADDDGYGNPLVTQVAISKPNGYVAVAGDCNDTTSLVHPGVAEQCNGVDDDCDAGTADGSSVSGIGTACDGDDTDVCEEGVWVCSGILGVECTDGAGSAVEICNGLDDDCNGTPDDGLTNVTYYRDADADTYGDAGTTSVSCAQPVGYVANSLDCDDSSAATKPGVTDACDGTDNDCDGSTDEDAASSTYYIDVDGDGWGNAGVSTSACSAPLGYAVVAGDCDDSVSGVNPDAVEACNTVDDDCDGATADGTDEIWIGAACDGADTDECVEAVYTCATGVQTCNDTADNDVETCDGVDNDCDGLVDDGFTVSTWYRDEDSDAYGTAATTLDACVQPVGYVAASGDCNDADGNVNPGRAEVCNGGDDDCDGTPDDGLTLGTYYADVDGDGQGTSTSSQNLCTATPGWVASSTDCDDTNENIYLGAVEVCDGLDNDCDSTPDDGLTFATYYLDGDADGYGLSMSSVSACAQPVGYSTVSGDCNDASASVKPGVAEACDGVDNDCDGATADGAAETWLGQSCDGADTDACNEAVMVCNAGAPLCPDTGDDDVEVCDGMDNDCDGTPDDGLALTAYFRDADGDGYGTAADSVFACAQAAGWVLNATDCADADVARNPGATETCNDIDDDCDGTPDDGLAQTTYYRDVDGDGYGDAADSLADCSQPAGRVLNATDCADADVARNPGATETCNDIDDDCDGTPDDGLAQTPYYRDVDGDGYGDAADSVADCSQPVGRVSNDDDCADADNARHPGATEACDGVDNDCDGTADSVTCSTTDGGDTDSGDPDGADTVGADTGTDPGTDPGGGDAVGDIDTTPTDDDTSGGNDGGAAGGGCSCSARSSGDEGLVWWLGALLVPWMRKRRRA